MFSSVDNGYVQGHAPSLNVFDIYESFKKKL